MSRPWGNCQLPPKPPQQSQLSDKALVCEKSFKQCHQKFDTDTRIRPLPKQNISFSTTTLETYPYERSIASSASSSVSSVFSDTASQTSSASSNSQVEGDETSSDRPSVARPANEINSTTFFPGLYHGQQLSLGPKNPGIAFQAPAPAPAPLERHQHPRRCSLAGSKRPPTLVRQSERKVNFVDNLVGKLAILVPTSPLPS